MEWVEVKGRTVEIAVQAALEELGLESAERAEIEVIQEPDKGFLGIGRQDAIVRVKPQKARRRRRRRGKGGGDKQSAGSADSGRRQRQPKSKEPPRSGQGRKGAKEEGADKRPGQQPAGSGGPSAHEKGKGDMVDTDSVEEAVSREEQAEVVAEFLSGLLDSFGLEGSVTTSVEDDIIHVKVEGDQTEALVGARGQILQAVNELCRTVVQRRTRQGARLRLDIAGYNERRREALRIYAGRLAQQVKDEGGEIMLEPMNAAERKVIHDAIVDMDGVRSYSEGEEPHRSVVISPE